MSRFTRALSLAIAAVLLATAAGAYPRPGRTVRISMGFDGEPQGGSMRPGLSGDGRLVVFESGASNIVEGDTNEQPDIFVKDRVAGVTELVSSSAGGVFGNSASRLPSISEDGRYVSFVSVASNLVPGVIGQQIYLKDRQTGGVEAISVSGAGIPGNSESLTSQVVAGGRFVVFDSLSGNLVAGDTNSAYDAFIRDRATGKTERVSISSAGVQGNGLAGGSPVVSADGRYVAFFSWSTTSLVANDLNNTQDIFMRDRVAGTTERVSLAADDAEANSLSYGHAISADGRYVSFMSLASNLVPNDFNGSADAFVRDRVAGTTERLSVTSDGAEASGFLASMISGDGRYVAFHAADGRLFSGGIPGALNLFVHDRRSGITEHLTLTDGGEAMDNYAAFGSLSADGRFAGFDTLSTNLAGPDGNDSYDVFVRDRGPALGAGELRAEAAGEGLAVSGWATFSGGPVVAADDPSADAVAGPIGGELLRASLVSRPEREDLLARIEVTDLPGFREPAAACAATLGACVGSAGGVPVVLYGMEFRVGTVRHELRAIRRQGASLPSAAGAFAHYRCEASCVKVGDLAGGYGTGGNHVTIAIPLSAIGASEGTVLTGVRAFTAVGEEATGGLVPLDEVTLGGATIPARSVRLGLAPEGTPEGEVAFDTAATLQGGVFAGTLPKPGGGSLELWARTCLGLECAASRISL